MFYQWRNWISTMAQGRAMDILCTEWKLDSVLTIEGHVCDHVLVLVNGELIAPKQLKYLSDLDGFGFWRLEGSSLILNEEPIRGATLDIIVEEMGRFNVGKFNQYNHTFKGLWQGNVTINGENIYDWTIMPLEWKTQWVNELEGWEDLSDRAQEAPTMYNSVLHISDEPQDTFVDTRGWGKGLIFVNGFALGRYVAIGPQKSLYLPGPLLKTGENQINFFEHFYSPEDGLIKFTDQLILEGVF
ncbi:hypothetical protein YQE_03756, partial [Dendroctonus ponderosae]